MGYALINVAVVKQGRNWKFGKERKSGEFSKPKGKVVHLVRVIPQLINEGRLTEGWLQSSCGTKPTALSQGWMTVGTDSIEKLITCQKCLKRKNTIEQLEWEDRSPTDEERADFDREWLDGAPY